jgi:hypothetical protein
MKASVLYSVLMVSAVACAAAIHQQPATVLAQTDEGSELHAETTTLQPNTGLAQTDKAPGQDHPYPIAAHHSRFEL